MKTLRSFDAIIKFFFVALLLIVLSLKPGVFQFLNSLFSHTPFNKDAHLITMLLCAKLLLIWGGILQWSMDRIYLEHSHLKITGWIPLLGLGAGLLLFSSLFLTTNRWFTFLILSIPTLFFIILTRGKIRIRFTFRGSFLFWLFTLFFIFIFIFESIPRAIPSGDEINFWYTSSKLLHRIGFGNYLLQFNNAGYEPLYPIFTSFFITPFTKVSFEILIHALPFFFGFNLWLVLADTAFRNNTGKRDLQIKLILYFSSIFLFCVSDSWFRSLFYKLWYGEALTILISLASLLFIFDHHAARNLKLDSLIAFGFGISLSLTKLPVSTSTSIFLIFILLIQVFLKTEPSWFKKKIFFMLLGSFTGALLWKLVLWKYQIKPYYPISFQTFLNFDFKNWMHNILPYLKSHYMKQLILPFILLSFLSFIHLKKQWIPLSFALMNSFVIFLIYATVWKDFQEYESSARYLLMGLIPFFLITITRISIFNKNN